MELGIISESDYQELKAEVLPKNEEQSSAGVSTAPAAIIDDFSQPNMVLIPAGRFWMGVETKDEAYYASPRHQVEITKDFYVGKYPVTQVLWKKVMGTNPSTQKGDNRPVESISWLDCVRFCNKLSKQEDRKPVYTIRGKEVSCNWNADGYRLLKEAEWEYAARGKGGDISTAKARLKGGTVGWEYAARAPAIHPQGARAKYPQYAARGVSSSLTRTSTKDELYAAHGRNEDDRFAGSNDLDEVAWHGRNSGDETHPVGQKKPNGFGLYDMSGNVAELVWDNQDQYGYGEYEKRVGKLTIDPTGPATGFYKIRRSFGYAYQDIKGSHIASRGGVEFTNSSFSDLGFRIARNA